MTLSMILALIFLAPENTEAQRWKKLLKNKTIKKKKDKDKKKEKDKTSDVKKDDNKNKTQSIKTLVFDPQKPIFVEYESLFKKMNLDSKTGKLEVKELNFKNLPRAEFGVRDDYHKLTAILKSGNKVLQTYPYGGISKSIIGVWKKASLIGNISYTFTSGGKYLFEFQVDGQTVDKVNFDIIQVTNKNNVSGFFINDPMEKLGKITAQRISYGKPDPNSSLVFRFYEAVLDPEKKFVDASPISVRLMKVNTAGNDIYMGGYLEKEQRHNHKWKLTDNIFLSKPDKRYDYVTYSEVLNTDGKYYIDLFYDKDRYRYNFEVKNKKFISSLSDKSKDGMCWIEREYLGLGKYDGFKPSGKTAGVKENMRVMVKTGSTSRGYSVGKSVVFSDGQKISASISYKDNIKKKYMYRLVESVLSLKKGDKIIAQSINHNIFNGYSRHTTIVCNPDKMVMIATSNFTHIFMDALSKLPAGNHKLKLVYEIASGKDSDIVGLRNVTYKSKTGNPIFTKWAKDTKEQSEMSNAERGDLSFLRSPSHDWVLYKNNCGRVVWLRQDNYKEYYLYSGDEGRFDRARGYLEQWNFGTRKWKSIDDFKAYKTIYKLGQNEIAMLHHKQLPKEAIDKLKTIQDKEFTSFDAFRAKIKALVGDEIFATREQLILGTASIDYVKICR